MDEQKQLEKELNDSNISVSKDNVDKMKENIMSNTDTRWLGVGVHNVIISKVELIRANSGTIGIKFTAGNSDGSNNATMWLSEKALPYTIANLSRIAVHNTPESKKDALKTAFSNVITAKDAYDNAKLLVGKQAWFLIKESATQSYTDKDGNVRPSLEKSLLGYEPKQTPSEKKAQTVSKVESDMGADTSEPLDLSDIPF